MEPSSFLSAKFDCDLPIFFTFNYCFLCSVIPPRVTEEADRMMRKLRALQTEVEDKVSALARRESQMKMLEAEKDAALKRLRDAEGTNIPCPK